jgi:hypothetical protein
MSIVSPTSRATTRTRRTNGEVVVPKSFIDPDPIVASGHSRRRQQRSAVPGAPTRSPRTYNMLRLARMVRPLARRLLHGRRMKRSSIVLTLSLVSSIAAAETPNEVKTQAPDRTISINLDAAPALLHGMYGGNVEWLHGAHGVLVEGNYGQDAQQLIASAFRTTAGYRYHWNGRMDSGFVGVNASYASVTSTSDHSDSLTFRTVSVLGNVGKRWQLDNGMNFTARCGFGIAWGKLTTSSDDQFVMEEVADLDARNDIAVVWDSELSVGYSF